MAGWNPRANEIFLNACEIPAPNDRRAYLVQACGDDFELRTQVEKLLQAHDQAATFLENPLAGGLPAPDVTAFAAPVASGVAAPSQREKIGPYTLLEPLGEGGMGFVWLAEQLEPLRRRVAVKIIKPGLSSPQVLARFEQERQALALMDHPNIAKVLDAGTTADGRPYFVMELIKGLPITRYCDDGQVPLRERLEMFAQVCDAVQHAHQKGIIHRDLKPSNVLITLSDNGRPVAKVIDFGVAKAVGQQLTEQTVNTEFGSLIGTLEYMSPEQAQLTNLDIDTRADIYSLGVLLYELLTGSPPFSTRELREVAFTEMLRMIREVDPPKPSTRAHSAAALPSIAAQRRVEPTRLTNYLKGDLDWIVMKCLDKDRNQRYDSANALGEDLRRFLNDEPVAAGPPSARYRLQKFIRRNRRLVLAAIAFLLVLVIGFAGTAWGMIRARQAETLALARLAQVQRAEALALARLQQVQAAEIKTKQALQESEEARELEKATGEFMIKAFGRADPGQDGRNVTVLAVLDATARDLESQFKGSDLLKAGLQHQLGLSYTALGMPDRALPFFEKAEAIRRKLLGARHVDTLLSQMNTGSSLSRMGKDADALRIAQETHAAMVAAFGPEAKYSLSAAYNLSVQYCNSGRTEEGISLATSTLERMRKVSGDDALHTIACMTGLADALRDKDLAAASKLAKEADERANRVLGPVHDISLASRVQLGNILCAEGKAAEAVPLLQELVQREEIAYGPDHFYTLDALSSLGYAERDAGRPADGRSTAKLGYTRALGRYGKDAKTTHRFGFALALLHNGIKEFAEALPLLEASLPILQKSYNPSQLDYHRIQLVVCYDNTGQPAKAIEVLDKVITERSTRLGAQHAETVSAREWRERLQKRLP
jgi:serine/threonine protein kinase